MTRQEIKNKFPQWMEIDAAQRCEIVAVIMEIYDRYDITPSGLRNIGDALDWRYYTEPDETFAPYTRDEIETFIDACKQCLQSIDQYDFGFGMYEENLNPFKIWPTPPLYEKLQTACSKYVSILKTMLFVGLFVDGARIAKLADASVN